MYEGKQQSGCARCEYTQWQDSGWSRIQTLLWMAIETSLGGDCNSDACFALISFTMRNSSRSTCLKIWHGVRYQGWSSYVSLIHAHRDVENDLGTNRCLAVAPSMPWKSTAVFTKRAPSRQHWASRTPLFIILLSAKSLDARVACEARLTTCL